ncbi:MAG: class I SAM-dependent methyltransferase [Verrucomicrobiae bacterium]|nr:class I SAM-dependent methyltransferase [Verrucomicrobiae bacterium]
MEDLKDVVEWDVATWSRAVRYWGETVSALSSPPQTGLELGARNGGVSCYFASKFGCRMACTDVETSPAATELHQRHGVSELISYREVDACSIPWEDCSFDFVVFKSILGVVGARGQRERQAEAMAEIHRVLRPGGRLLFAENLRASRLHQTARHWFVPWGKSWTYVTLEELRELLGVFKSVDLRSTGFSSAFVPKPEFLRTICAAMDDSLLRCVPKNWNYVGYGHAIK